MNQVKKITLILLMLLTSANRGMEPASLPTHSMAHLCGGPASAHLMERLAHVKKTLSAHNLLDNNKPIYLGYLNQSSLDSLKKEGCSIRYNGLTNGVDAILVEKHLEELPTDQQDAALAHELAHICLRSKGAYLNPHNWLNESLLNAAELLRVTSLSALVYSLWGKEERNPLQKQCRKYGLIGLALAPSLLLAPGLLLGAKDAHNNNCPVEYSVMQKPEEIMCDIIAATSLPQGGQKGAQLYRTKLTHNGNRNGHNGDHPYTKTRIWYHDQIANLQKLIDKIE